MIDVRQLFNWGNLESSHDDLKGSTILMLKITA